MDNSSKQNINELAKDLLRKMVGYMNMDCEIEVKEELDDRNSKSVVFSIYTPENARFLIGKNGQNIASLEQVLRAMLLRKMPEAVKIAVDVNNYKKIRSQYIVDIARQAVARVRSTQKSESLSPMSAYERRVVHMELASYPDIATESIGEEPSRQIIIKPYP